jgi:hypothetical protein
MNDRRLQNACECGQRLPSTTRGMARVARWADDLGDYIHGFLWTCPNCEEDWLLMTKPQSETLCRKVFERKAREQQGQRCASPSRPS